MLFKGEGYHKVSLALRKLLWQFLLIFPFVGVQCDVITGIYNGKVKASRPYDDEPVLKFECNSGYELQGKDKLTCKQGKWDHAKPRCISRLQFTSQGVQVVNLYIIQHSP